MSFTRKKGQDGSAVLTFLFAKMQNIAVAGACCLQVLCCFFFGRCACFPHCKEMRLAFAIGLRRNYGKEGALNEEKRHVASDCGRIGLMRSKWIVTQEGSGRIGKSMGEIADQRLSSPTTPANRARTVYGSGRTGLSLRVLNSLKSLIWLLV